MKMCYMTLHSCLRTRKQCIYFKFSIFRGGTVGERLMNLLLDILTLTEDVAGIWGSLRNLRKRIETGY